jgi:predicted RNase H-like nuclease (RuvC/YqgF family)
MFDQTGHASCEHCRKDPSPTVQALIEKQSAAVKGTEKGEFQEALSTARNENLELKAKLQRQDSEIGDLNLQLNGETQIINELKAKLRELGVHDA